MDRSRSRQARAALARKGRTIRFSIRHTTRYSYGRPVVLGPTTVRLRPRGDGTQRVERFHARVTPAPVGQSEGLDAEGNPVLHLWFEGAQDFLSIVTSADVTTLRTNPFDFVALDSTKLQLPIAYAPSVAPVLAAARDQPALPPELVSVADDLLAQCEGQATEFLQELARLLAREIRQQVRLDGDAYDPVQTWATRQGACRDVSVLFIALSRYAGIATRFVSGYVYGFLQDGRPELHAWVEAYLPGGGWRGFDPSMGAAVADRHVAVAASARPELAAPISGAVFDGTVDATLWYDIKLSATE